MLFLRCMPSALELSFASVLYCAFVRTCCRRLITETEAL